MLLQTNAIAFYSKVHLIPMLRVLPKVGCYVFGVNEKWLTQHISGLLTRYKLLYVSNQGRVGTRARAKG